MLLFEVPLGVNLVDDESGTESVLIFTSATELDLRRPVEVELAPDDARLTNGALFLRLADLEDKEEPILCKELTLSLSELSIEYDRDLEEDAVYISRSFSLPYLFCL